MIGRGLLFIALFDFLTLTPIGLTARAAEELNTPDGIVIDELSLVGVSIFSQSDLEKILEISPGDKLNRKKIVQTATNIQDLYRTHGFEEVRVRSELLRRSKGTTGRTENVVEINISEGRPTRISAIEIIYDDPKVRKKMQQFESRIGVAPGDVLDHEKLANGYRTFQDALSTKDYMGAKVEVATEEKVSAPVSLPGFEKVPVAATWKKLSIRVALGERVTFGYQGSTVFSAQQLDVWVEEQRLLGYSADYVQRIQDRILDEYRRLGYEHTSIDVYTFETSESRRHVSLQIKEGSRVKISRIVFDGNVAFNQYDLLERFEQVASPVLARGYYVAKDIEVATNLVAEWMRSKGFLASRIVSLNKEYVHGDDRVQLTVYLYEGEQTLIQNIEFTGLKVFPKQELKTILGIQEDAPLNLYALSDGLEVLKAKYRANGYLDIEIVNEGKNDLVSYDADNRIADIMIALKEGPQYRVSRIEISGQSKTKTAVIERELRLKVGEVLEEPKLLESELRLRRLGIFSSASIKLFEDPESKKSKILRVQVEEGTPGLLAGGVGLRNDIGGRVFGQVAYSNLFGRNHTISLTTGASRRFKGFGSEFCASDREKAEHPGDDHCFIEFNTQLGYAWPWALLGETTFRPSLNFERTQFKNFDADSLYLQLTLQRMLVQKWNLTGSITYSLENTRQYNANSAIDEQRLRIGSFIQTLILDRRDNQLAPSRGTYTTISAEFARPEFLSQRTPAPVSYSKFQFRNDAYFPFPKDMGLFLSFRTGLVYNFSKAPDYLDPNDPVRDLYGIPLIKQFALGGVGSLRGYRESSINSGRDVIAGYASYVNYRTQFDFPFSGALRMGPFVDAANLNLDTYSFGHLKFGIGFGLHYRSPVGPVNFDIGFNPSPKTSRVNGVETREDSYRIHFSIGNL